MSHGKVPWRSLGVLLVVLSGYARGQTECPPPSSIEPCKCTRSSHPVTVECTHQSDQSALQKMFDRSDHPFAKLVLDRTALMYVPAGAVSRRRIRQITVANCSMQALFDRAPDPDNQVSHLHVLNSTLQRGLQWQHLRTLEGLLDLTVESVGVRQVGKAFRESVTPTLRKLQLFDTGTRHFSADAFDRFVDLRTIAVVKTRLAALKRSMFPKKNQIFIMDFSYNFIETLPDDLFSDMEVIRDVYLYGNRLKVFSEAVFGHVMDTTAMTINLQENPINCDCTIKWFLYKVRYVTVVGTCGGPVDKTGKRFRELRRKEFEHCPSAPQDGSTTLDWSV